MGKTIFVCQQCGAEHKKWMGRCLECCTWNSIVEEVSQPNTAFSFSKDVLDATRRSGYAFNKEALLMTNLSSEEDVNQVSRYSSGISEFDRVVGGGIVPGSTILLYGEPGIGKSTLLLQILNSAANSGVKCLYVTGEESADQVKIRAKRLDINNKDINLLVATNIVNIVAAANKMRNPALLVIDSIQTMHAEEINSAPGTVTQIKVCTFEISKITKHHGIALLIVGHVTKEGQVAGPKLLEHMVDTVLSFEGDGSEQYRIIRTTKNRYGSTNELGVFTMCEKGLVEVQNPSNIFISDSKISVSGACIFAGYEGSRSILLEVQALVVPSFLALPRRSAIGLDTNRLAMIVAIISSCLGFRMDNDVYLNIVSGLRITEPAVDLPAAAAIISAKKNILISHDTAFFGEIGLLGELRQISHSESRINEAIKLGIKRIVMPVERGVQHFDNKLLIGKDVEIVRLSNIQELLRFLEADCKLQPMDSVQKQNK